MLRFWQDIKELIFPSYYLLHRINVRLHGTLSLKACQGPDQVQNLDRLGLFQVNSAIKSRLAVQYSSSGGASLPDCVDKNSKTNDGGKAW